MSMSSVPWITSVFGSSMNAPKSNVLPSVALVYLDSQDVMLK
jgi:hypothetical protein